MITIKTPTPKKLLAAIKKAINEQEIRTWSYDEDGDFTHTSSQWNKKAWFRPTILEKTSLTLSFVPPQNIHLTTATKSEYSGAMTYSLLYHFSTLLNSINVTP